jgi:hypothetical protein
MLLIIYFEYMYNFVISKFIKITVVTKCKRTGIDQPYYIFYRATLTTSNILVTYMYIYIYIYMMRFVFLAPAAFFLIILTT